MIVFVAQLTAADVELPDGKGKEIVQSTCTECHSTERIRVQHLDEEGWNGIIREMMETGASIDSDNIKVIVSYLTANFGPDSDKRVNVNTASASRIADVLQLTPSEADSIVEYRAKHGSFKSLNDLEKMPGLADKIQAKKPLIEF